MKGSLISSQVAEPYAQALMSVAETHNLMESLGEDIRSLLALLTESEELQLFMTNPVVQGADKYAVLQRIIGDRGNPYLTNFLKLLVDKGRAPFLVTICQQFLTLLRQKTNTILAEVTAAQELTDEQRHAVSEKVRELAGADSVEIQTTVDASLIGGVIIKVGSQVFDASLRGQLRRIGLSLGSAS